MNLLNVEYKQIIRRINVEKLGFGQVLDAIKDAFDCFPESGIQLRNQHGTIIIELDEIGAEYYVERGPSLSISMLPKSTNPPHAMKTSMKKMTVQESCRKYLDALATKLATYYAFPWTFGNPTMSDILRAKNENTWTYINASSTYTTIDSAGYARTIKKDQPLLNIALNKLYTPQEWDLIAKLNYNPDQMYDAGLARDVNANPYIIVFSDDATSDNIELLKDIGVRGTLFTSPDALQVNVVKGP